MERKKIIGDLSRMADHTNVKNMNRGQTLLLVALSIFIGLLIFAYTVKFAVQLLS